MPLAPLILMAVSRDGVISRRLSLLTYDLVRLILRPKDTFDIPVVVKNSSTVMGAPYSIVIGNQPMVYFLVDFLSTIFSTRVKRRSV